MFRDRGDRYRIPCVWCRERYNVEIVTTNLNMPLWEAFEVVRSTDVFLGMHGAAFANLLALHQVNAQGGVRPCRALQKIRRQLSRCE